MLSVRSIVINMLIAFSFSFFFFFPFCLRDLFGLGLGTGDYGHLTVEHTSMLLRNFRSLRDYSNQGFEASHKLQKQIYSRATNHDGSGEASSCK